VGLDAASSGVRFQNGLSTKRQQGEISFNGSTGLQQWSSNRESPLTLQAKVTKLSVADLERLAKAQYPITGDLSANFTPRLAATARRARLAAGNESSPGTSRFKT